MRLTRLRLQNWRNFKNAEVQLSSRAFFVGPNAAGKSNLLEALRFLRDLVTAGGLSAAVEHRGGVSKLRCVQATSNTDIGISVDIGTDAQPAMWSYSVKFNQDKGLKRPAIVSEEIHNQGKVVKTRPNGADRSDALLRSQTYLEQVQQNKDFRAIAEFFASVPRPTDDSRRAANQSLSWVCDAMTSAST